MAGMTPEEYEGRKRRLEADFEDAKKAFQNARGNLVRISAELQNLRIDYREQQQRDASAN